MFKRQNNWIHGKLQRGLFFQRGNNVNMKSYVIINMCGWLGKQPEDAFSLNEKSLIKVKFWLTLKFQVSVFSGTLINYLSYPRAISL